MQYIHGKLSAGLSWQKRHSKRRRFFISSKLHLTLKKKLVIMPDLEL